MKRGDRNLNDGIFVAWALGLVEDWNKQISSKSETGEKERPDF